MSTESKKELDLSTTTKPSAVFTVEDAINKLKAIEDNVMKYAGKAGHNPFMYLDSINFDMLKKAPEANLKLIESLPINPVPLISDKKK